jgi:hypothetical protein
MHEYSSQQEYFPNNILDSVNILLLEKFKKYNSKGHKLICSYMSVGQKYKNELLIIGREPSYWPAVFSTEELNEMGAEYIFNTKVRYHAVNASYNSMVDPFCGCTKDILIKLGICHNETNWSSYIALSYLYKIAFSSNRYLMDKPRMMQLEYCKEIFELEISALRPKRILFLTGMKYARDFLNLSDCSGLEDCVCPLGEFDFGFHKAQTVVSVHPKKYRRKELVREIIKGFEC